jgi:hypothetical protein
VPETHAYCPCAWCGEPGVTEVVVVAGKKNRKTSSVCEEHAAKFEQQGQMTTRLEMQQKVERQERSRQWKHKHLRY